MRILNFITALALSAFAISAALPALPDGLVYAKDGSGVYGYKNTPKLPWCEWLVHDPDRPAPIRIDPGPFSASVTAPSDATVLFNGNDLSKWAGDWTVQNSDIMAGAGSFSTKESFGNMQLHVEWMAPADWEGPWYNRGNNGVILMGHLRNSDIRFVQREALSGWAGGRGLCADAPFGECHAQGWPMANLRHRFHSSSLGRRKISFAAANHHASQWSPRAPEPGNLR
jgi:hypothetical protein